MKIQDGETLVMIGDSITDAGRAKPAGEGKLDALGTGYVNLFNSALIARYPERMIRIINMGLSGNTVRDLKARWQTDVLERKPDWLSIMIGINDVWRFFSRPTQYSVHVGIEEYATTLEALIDAALPSLKGLILATPYFIENNPNDAMRQKMDEYGAVVKKLAVQKKAILVDTQAPMDAYLAHRHSSSIAGDRIHMNTTGHMILARAFLVAVGFEG